MKPRWVIATVLLTLAIVGVVLLLLWPDSAQTALQQTRRELRQQGFKIDLAEFDFSASAEQTARAAALTNAGATTGPYRGNDPTRRAVLAEERLNLMQVAGSNAAQVVWRQLKLPARSGPYPWLGRPEIERDFWPALREEMNEDRAIMDAACAAALAAPIRFNLAANHGSAMLLPHLAGMRNLAQLLGTRAMLELHDGHPDAAWTNVLACTRLATAYDPESTEVSHLVRFGCAGLAYDTAWQAFQAGNWPDARLAQLQHEWESADFFKNLPETEAFSRASHAALCQRERREPLPPNQLVRDLRQSPRYVWSGLVARWQRMNFRHHGSYDLERALLLYHRDRELQFRRAIQASTWQEMRPLPGVTNAVPFYTKYPSAVMSIMNLRQISLGFMRGGQGMLGRAAEAEARRRLLVTAIALERYRGRHGSYPQTLDALVPELLAHPPVDFMDGQPLRYCPTPDGRFLLYSTGVDCVDDGGDMRRPRSPMLSYLFTRQFGYPEGADLVWPRPASPAEVQAQQQEDERQAALAKEAMEEKLAESRRRAEQERVATIERLLADAEAASDVLESSRGKTNDPVYHGRPLSQLLRNKTTAGTNRLAAVELLTARQITNREYDGTVCFEVPVSYHAATNLGRIHLVVDGGLDMATRREEGERQTCERATNGNCLLGWTSTYDPPGRHALQAEFIATRDQDKEGDALKVQGLAVPFVSSNLCQFDSAYDHFDTNGVTLFAKLPESNGVYIIELKSTAGEPIKTFTGTTSNGVINVHWDLIDDRGVRCTNQVIDTFFQVTLPASGRSQRLKGP
jgi:hypothetical protein